MTFFHPAALTVVEQCSYALPFFLLTFAAILTSAAVRRVRRFGPQLRHGADRGLVYLFRALRVWNGHLGFAVEWLRS